MKESHTKKASGHTVDPHPVGPVAMLSPLIHLIDDDEAVRSALALLISTVGLRVQSWADPAAFTEGFDRQAIGAIVLDVRMPGISGLTVLDALTAQGVDQPIIMLTGHGTVEMCRRAFKSGAAEFLEKPVNDEQLLEALQNAVRQHVKSRARNQTDQQTKVRFSQLSAREREVLALVGQGLSNPIIARRLGLGLPTVKHVIASAMTRLGASTRGQAAVLAAR